MTETKRNPCLGREIFKIESKKLRDICCLKCDNTVKTGYCLNIVISEPNDQLYRVSKSGFRVVLVTLYFRPLALTVLSHQDKNCSVSHSFMTF
jgi:hypothetical protein